MEAVGVVEVAGPGLTGRQVGDLVAYAGYPMGSYAEEEILPADRVVHVPSCIDPSIAASVMLKGMTAQFLVCRCFKGSLACLKTRGYMVSFGQSSGSPDPLPLSSLAPKSLFLTRPSLYNYTLTGDELLEAAGEVFANVASGVRVNHTYLLSKAHADLENRKKSGSIVLIPDGI
ncbi:hypothetical protein POM88_047319 [Heracleum sosnowskyi]|uniref:Quinone oxidoreductase n=1 Tax=Heracleum sosnowskyi TaxID=360622 RepID=A0AAD8LZD9_9APIA|nr:hypothetical protein POM88_047319 [Heracleum sosnowskyi]